MTYLARARVHRPAKRRQGMGDIMDLFYASLQATGLTLPSDEKQCLDAANQQMGPFDAKIDDLNKNWNPTGFYTPTDLRTIVQQGMAAVANAQSVLNQAAAQPNGLQDSVMRATDDLGRAGQRSLDYLQAATQAEQQGLRTVNAPGLKRWLTDTLAMASSAMVTAAVITCLDPWWLDALATYQTVFDNVWTVVKRVVGAVIAIGETTLKVADDLPRLYDLLKWGALAAGGYWIWSNYLRKPGT